MTLRGCVLVAASLVLATTVALMVIDPAARRPDVGPMTPATGSEPVIYENEP